MQSTETPRNYQLALLERGLFRETLMVKLGEKERRTARWKREDGRGKYMIKVGII